MALRQLLTRARRMRRVGGMDAIDTLLLSITGAGGAVGISRLIEGYLIPWLRSRREIEATQVSGAIDRATISARVETGETRLARLEGSMREIEITDARQREQIDALREEVRSLRASRHDIRNEFAKIQVQLEERTGQLEDSVQRLSALLSRYGG